MSDPIEKALEKMKPADLPPALMARLTAVRPMAEGYEQPRKASLFRKWLLPLTAGACAAAVTLAFLKRDGESKPEQSIAAAATIPMERNDFIVGARHVGVMVGPDQRPYRIVEVEWKEEDTFRPKNDGSALRVETTRRQVVPVALDIY